MIPIRNRHLPLPLLAAVLALTAGIRGQDKSPTAPHGDASKEAIAGVRELLEKARTERHFPGCVAAFSLRGNEVHVVAVGTAGGQELGADSRMLSGSIGKSYLGAIAALLASRKELDLDLHLAGLFGKEDWYRGLPNAADLTLRMLLHHQSGLRDHVWVEAFQRDLLAEPDRTWTAEELVGYLGGSKALFEPGAGWAYADTNFVLAGLAIERVTKKPYDELLRTLILEPMQLHETAASDSRKLPGLVPGIASGIAMHRGPVVVDGHYFVNPQFENRGGGLYCSTRDLARFCRELFAGKSYPQAARDLLCETVETKSRVCERYGIGVMLDHTDSGPRFGHSGFMPGYLSRMSWYPDLDLAVAIQFDTDDVRGIGRSVEAWTDAIAIALCGKRD